MSEKYGTLMPAGRLLDGKPRTILFDATRCIGCRQCVHACKDWNDHPRTSVYEISPSNWITMEPPVLEGLSPLWSRNSCMHCEFPMCAAVCPVEAITKYDEGPVVINKDVCIGCEYCIHACPWGVISQNAITKKAEKCTMCSDRVSESKQPFCVQACPVGALDFGLHEEIQTKAKGRAEEISGYLYGDKEAGGTPGRVRAQRKKAKIWRQRRGATEVSAAQNSVGVNAARSVYLACGLPGKLRALYLAVVHPKRLLYRYWPWRSVV
jgi:Fe-S-cluster-containing dehydrogenase component